MLPFWDITKLFKKWFTFRLANAWILLDLSFKTAYLSHGLPDEVEL